MSKSKINAEELFKDMTQIGTQDILDGVRINKEKNPRQNVAEYMQIIRKKIEDLKNANS